MPAIVVWFLRKASNRARHDGAPFLAPQAIHDIDSFVVQLGRALLPEHCIRDLEHPWAPVANSRPKRLKVCAVAWSKPPLHKLKLNIDASISGARAVGRGLVHDHTGRLVFAFYKEFGEVDTLTTEALSLWHGLLHCRDRNLSDLLVEVDSEALVRLLQFGATAKWPLCNTLRSTRGLLANLSSTVRHVFREANSCADKIAGGKFQGDSIFFSVRQLPPAVQVAMHMDRWEVPCLRFWVVK
nr:uncharacterized protein LOC113735829 [Coffea arabica]